MPVTAQRAPQRTKRPSKGVTIVIVGIGLFVVSVIAVVSSSSDTSTTTAASSTASTGGSETSNPSDPVEQICRFASGDGSYYVNVTSLPGFKASACDGAEPFSGVIDDLLNLPGVAQRCTLGTDHAITSTHAMVSVYSTGNRPDLATAQAFCNGHGGTQP